MTRAAALGALLLCAATAASAEPLAIEAHPIESFRIVGAELDGPLQFVGGLQLSANDEAFGGLSGIEIRGERAFMVGDRGALVTARLVHEDGRLVGLADADIALLSPSERRAGRDVEDIAFDPADPECGVVVRERQANALLGFTLVDGRPVDFAPVTVGAENSLLRSNHGLESVAYAPAASPAAGRIVAIAERGPDDDAIPGWIAGVGPFSIVRRDDFDVSSARFLPDGDLLILERRISAFGFAARLRRIPGETLAVGALLDGEYLLDAGMTSPIDNMEGLAVSRDAAGRLLVTLLSDDNKSLLQRTLLLQFVLAED